MITDLVSDFPPLDYSIWLEKVQAELKGKSLDQFNYMWDGVAISPFEIPASNPVLVEGRKDNSWKIGSYVEAYGNRANADLLLALSEGAQSIFMEIGQKPDWLSLLNKVHLEWIHINFKFSHLGELNSFLQYQEHIGKELKGSIQVVDIDRIALFKRLASQGGWKLLNYELNDMDSRHALAGIFHQLTRDISLLSVKNDPLSVLSRVVIHVRGQNDLILNISMVRAIRILWKLLMSSAGFESGYPEIYLIAHIADNKLQDPFIRSSLVAASLILGGVDELFIENHNDKHQGRYGRMIQHIYTHEAKLGKVADPLWGSRVIEHLTDVIVQRVWNESIRLDQLKK